ncbi:glycoside hydrolase family 2 TIM barrel-domain containing protein [Lactiplantibacillus nangangensis]|uniref:Glycoside hydrolase family 2 TIM barrel-domain containing protein n=1 Tax=Lactiplantibacillus nangangensis TaxID=2559917 RepID=A0ABW1SF90_9LACO|nr:glycoside hydrolase family 2 TIM barrel-domain containing protein [Lactiplantibacillus nangangensis]
MHTKKNLNNDWRFHFGELTEPKRTAKKSMAFGGLTAPLPNETGERVQPSAGGVNFLKLIAQGNIENGLRNLAGTDLESQLDASWEKVTLPHDWQMSRPYQNDPQNLMSGSKPAGVGYYRRTFTLSDEVIDRNRVILHFDGIMRMADVWLNGAYLGHNNSGYTAMDIDITEMAHYGAEGDNVILVRVDTTTGPEGWWYEGAGIYKPVWLEFLPLTYIDNDSIYAYTTELTANEAKIAYEFSIVNAHEQAVTVQPQVTIVDQTVKLATTTVSALGQRTFKGEVTVDQPRCWTPETPNLTTIGVAIDQDQLQRQFGIHTFKYDENGFILNGQHYELHGVCEHQDMAGVGTALNQDLMDYKVSVMKKMGVNAWRSSHQFASEELLSACDRYGIILIDENRLLETTPWRLADLQKMVKRSRLHAAIAFWSIANEEIIGNTALGGRMAKKLVQTIKGLDREHLIISAELLSPAGTVDEDYLANLDVLGVNYPEAGVMGAGAEIIKQQHPHLPMMSTENASYFSTRGAYQDDADHCQANNFGSMYSMVLPGKRQPGDPGVGGTARPETVMAYLKAHPYMGGVFLWTAMDYFGEPSPFGWPAISSQFGITDTGGLPKDYYYYYQAHWTTKPMVHVMPHWNQAGLALTAAGDVAVRAFSNAETVELFVNDHSYGRQTVVDCEANWQVPYAAGTLKVVALDHDEVVATDQRVTSEVATETVVEPLFNGKTTEIYRVKALDVKHHLAPMANGQLQVSVTGGQVLGLGNGNPADQDNQGRQQIHLFNGYAVVIVHKTAPTVTVTAKLAVAVGV